MQSNSLVIEQVPPQNNHHRPVWEEVIYEMETTRYEYGPELQDTIDNVLADMDDRNEEGIRKYNTPLQPFNGRDPLIDLYQELLDAAVYARQYITEIELHLDDGNTTDDQVTAAYKIVGDEYDSIMDGLVRIRACISHTEPE